MAQQKNRLALDAIGRARRDYALNLYSLKIMSTNEVINKVQESLKLAAQAARDVGELSWRTERHNLVVAATLAKAIANDWKPTPAEMFKVVQTTYNHSAWRQKFEKEGLFCTGRKSADRDISALLGQMQDEGIV